MRRIARTGIGLTFGLVLLTSCGGAEDTGAAQQAFIEAANAKEAEARRLGIDTPCDRAAQCGVLSFMSPVNQCPSLSFAAYSTVSAAASAASAASAEQVRLARRAQELYVGTPVTCIAAVAVAPGVTCAASRCQTVSQ